MISRQTAESILDAGGSPGAAGARLSPREADVLALASRGLTNRQIAAELHVTVHAVKFHLAGVYRKLGVSNRTEAVVHWLRVDAPRPADCEGLLLAVDLQLVLRVLWRFRLLVVGGLVVAALLAAFSYVKVNPSGDPKFTPRETEQWEALSTLFVTSRGFPWGSIGTGADPTDPAQPESDDGKTPKGLDPVHLTGLASLYVRLATSDPVLRAHASRRADRGGPQRVPGVVGRHRARDAASDGDALGGRRRPRRGARAREAALDGVRRLHRDAPAGRADPAGGPRPRRGRAPSAAGGAAVRAARRRARWWSSWPS